MPRYIDAETALKIIDNYAKTVTADGKVVVDAIRDIVGVITPTADVVPKSEVASEIFAEVNMQIIPYSTDIYIKGEELIIIPKSDYNAILTELEKKYTEGEDKPASEEKYFSPEDVRKMTNQEVREKYTAIRKSMERW